MADFRTYMQQPDVRLFAYAYVSGIPDVFANVPQPTRWTDLGTDRVWSETMIWFRPPGSQTGEASRFTVPSARVDWQSGLSVSGSLSLAFSVDPAGQAGRWVDLMLPTDRVNYYLARDNAVSPSQTNLEFADVGSLALGDYLYGGLETVRIASTPDTAANTAVVQRARFDSRSLWYDLARESEVTWGGPTVLSSAPQTWAGRTVEVWVAACGVDSTGALAPIDTAPQGSYSWQLFRGEVTEVSWHAGDTAVVLRCQDISQTMKAPVVRRPKRYRPGPSTPAPAGCGWTYLEPGGVSLV